jgi:UDP-N-acetylmuramoyl-tripeptide--D-alanyl-D-alanine ligase
MTMQLTWTADDVMRAVNGHSLHEQTWLAHGVSIDSRTVKAGDLFIALKGPAHDGHDHVAAAFAAGAVVAIVSHTSPKVSPQSPLIMCDDTFVALQRLGQAGRARSQATIIAVTGSVGKTGTKEMLRLMLSAMDNTHANEGGLNNHWGAPLTLARLPVDARFGVFELGMNHAGELTDLSQQVRPHISMITTIAPAHLEFFESLEAIADAKAEIFIGTLPHGAAILNHDNPYYGRLSAAAKKCGLKKIFSFGHDKHCEAQLKDYTATPEGGHIRAVIMGHDVDYLLGAPGEHLALNSLGALLTTYAAGGDIQVCAAALAAYKVPKGRGAIQTLALKGGTFTLIDESYNASPAAVRSAIKVLGNMKAENGRKILVLGDMRELGETSINLHSRLAQDILATDIDLVFCCGDLMRHLFDALPETRRGVHADNSALLASKLIKLIQPNDIMTVKGSLSMGMKMIIEALQSRAHSI